MGVARGESNKRTTGRRDQLALRGPRDAATVNAIAAGSQHSTIKQDEPPDRLLGD
jgi:hypothetical protein